LLSDWNYYWGVTISCCWLFKCFGIVEAEVGAYLKSFISLDVVGKKVSRDFLTAVIEIVFESWFIIRKENLLHFFTCLYQEISFIISHICLYYSTIDKHNILLKSNFIAICIEIPQTIFSIATTFWISWLIFTASLSWWIWIWNFSRPVNYWSAFCWRSVAKWATLNAWAKGVGFLICSGFISICRVVLSWVGVYFCCFI